MKIAEEKYNCIKTKVPRFQTNAHTSQINSTGNGGVYTAVVHRGSQTQHKCNFLVAGFIKKKCKQCDA